MKKRLSTVAFFAILLTGCAMHGNSIPIASSSAASASVEPNEASWRNALVRTSLPDAGCFQASYPSTRWKRVPCAAASNEGARNIVGAHGQLEAYVSSPAVIKEAIGSFPYVRGVTSEHSVPSGGGKPLGPNTFTLQMNSGTFATAACGTNQSCVGWEQFIFGNHPPGGPVPSRIFIQDWLLARSTTAITCPKGWSQAKLSCIRNTKALTVPYVQIRNLGSLTMWGRAEAHGDSIFLAIGKNSYAIRDAQPDRWLHLADHWGEVQFNVLGDGDSSIAVFNRGSTVVTQLQIETANAQVYPLCVLTHSSTGESNTLNYSSIPATPEPQQFPSIVYAESNAPKAGSAQCAVLPPAKTTP